MPGNVLYVDDDEDLCKLVARGLGKLGYTTSCSSTGVDALRLLKARDRRWHFVIIDIFIPGTSGIDLAWECLKFDSRLPVLLVSGAIRDRDIEQSGILGLTVLLKAQDDFMARIVAWITSRQPV